MTTTAVKRSPRGAITRAEVEDAAAHAELTDWLLDAITTNEDVRAAILRLTRARQTPAPPKTTARRAGRSR